MMVVLSCSCFAVGAVADAVGLALLLPLRWLLLLLSLWLLYAFAAVEL
jgi:hypothetical protein